VVAFRSAAVRRAVAVSESIGGPQRADPFPLATIEALRELVGAEAAGYCESPRVVGFGGYELGTRLPPAWLPDALRDHAREDPTHPLFCGRAGRSVAVSDLLNRREIERRGVYAAIWEPLGVRDSLRLYLRSDDHRCRFFFFDRRARGFPEANRQLLELLRPTLTRAREAWGSRSTGRRSASLISLREQEILSWVARGLTNDEIARRLWLSPHTVRTHLENVYRKLGVRTRTQAIASLTSWEPDQA
jgi:DNA-binding CsgD family transcriptional regulator